MRGAFPERRSCRLGLRYAEKTMKPLDPIDLTRRLVDIESLTYNEGAVGAYLDTLLRERGFAVERMEVSQPPQSRFSGPRFNLYASYGEQPDVVLSTHMDTVPPFIPSREDDLFLYGRGACDAKGIIAAQWAAAERLREAGVAAALLFVVGEERNSAGALAAAKTPRGSKFLINGEPTENKLALGSKGALRLELVASGRMAHSAYPELGESAIEKLLDALNAARKVPLPVDKILGASTLNIGTISGGRAPNVIPDHAQAELFIRLVDSGDATLEGMKHAVHGKADIREVLTIPAVLLGSLPGFETTVVSFTTDIPALGDAWGKPYLIGPGSIHVAHTSEERIPKAQILEAVQIYKQMVQQLL